MAKYLSTLVFALAALQTACASPMVETRKGKDADTCSDQSRKSTAKNVYHCTQNILDMMQDGVLKTCKTGQVYCALGDVIVATSAPNGVEQTAPCVDLWVSLLQLSQDCLSSNNTIGGQITVSNNKNFVVSVTN